MKKFPGCKTIIFGTEDNNGKKGRCTGRKGIVKDLGVRVLYHTEGPGYLMLSTNPIKGWKKNKLTKTDKRYGWNMRYYAEEIGRQKVLLQEYTQGLYVGHVKGMVIWFLDYKQAPKSTSDL